LLRFPLYLYLCPVVEAIPTSNTPQVAGYLGLGPNSGSRIYTSLNYQPQGESVLDRIFRQDLYSPNFLTVLLGRSSDPGELYPGEITLGVVLRDLRDITHQPRVPVTVLQSAYSLDQHWQVLLDEDGIIGPDGQPILVKTGVQSTSNPNQLTAFFDTGFTFPQVPLCVKHLSTFPYVRLHLLASSSLSIY
jgi:hypothetical protein